MASQITEEMRAKAEIYLGDKLGREKTKVLLKKVGLPTGLLPLKNITECGYHAETGFVWLKQEKKIEHKFEVIKESVSYGAEVFAYAEKQKIKKLSGVKAKDLLMWLPLSEISIDDNRRIAFKAPSGYYRTFPASAFETKDDLVKETTKPIEEPKEVKETMEVKEVAETNGLKETMEVKEVVETNGVKETMEVKEVAETNGVKETMEVNESTGVTETKLAAKTNGVKETMEVKETKQLEESKMVEKAMEGKE